MPLKLSIIIPIFNKKELTIQCLTSLNAVKTDILFEVIAVDNASTDGSDKEIFNLRKNLHYKLNYLKNKENLGFAKANNQGVKASEYSNLLFLNNDTIITQDFLSKPLALLNTPSIGIVGIKLLYPDNLIQHAGIAFDYLKYPHHVFRFYPHDYYLANLSREVQAVTGACLFIRRELYEKVGGFDERYINGWEDMDLCFKVRKLGKKVYYCSDVSICHLESQSEGRLAKSEYNKALFHSLWKEYIISDKKQLYSEIDSIVSTKSNKSKFDLPPQICFAIKIGVPSREHKNWGDIFYAQALAKELKKLGHNCILHYLNEWNQLDKNIDVVIHIKGLSRYKLKPHNINILWIINHPELHTIEEIDAYDIVFCASKKYLRSIESKVKVPLYYLPQATDDSVFKELSDDVVKDIDLLFIGNNYEAKHNRCRKIIEDILSLKGNYKLCIVGKNWDGYVDNEFIHGEFIEWENLPELYKRAKIVLNDHQETMRLNGFVNNRTYDLAAMRVFQISNEVEGIDNLGIVTYKDKTDLKEKLDCYLSNQKERERIALENYENSKTFTFSHRASEIVSLLNKHVCNIPAYIHCNICGHTGDDFLNMGSRVKVRCPICNSLERHRALWFLLCRDYLLKPGMTILEISPLSNKLFRKYIEQKGCKYKCIDKWKHGNPLDRRDTSWIDYEMDICDLKFQDKSFDLILMQHVIEEVPDDVKAFSEIARVLKDDGTAILEIPHQQNLRKTLEYHEPRKFGNVREYGVDVYERLSKYFTYREEVKIDNVPFSLLKKSITEKKLNFPTLIDHPTFENSTFEKRFRNALYTLNSKGFVSLTSHQVENLLYQKVFYSRPFWITLDDGKRQDIDQALPILQQTRNFATSFIPPSHLNDADWQKWQSVFGNRHLDIQCHSLSHRQHYVNDNLIDYYSGEWKYNNLIQNKELLGYPIFEYTSALISKAFVPYDDVIQFCLEFYETHKNLPKHEYLLALKEHLSQLFGSSLGNYETEESYRMNLEKEIISSKNLLIDRLKKEIFIFSFPWGTYSNEALKLVQQNYTLSARVLPQQINYEYSHYEINRIDIASGAFKEFLDILYRSSPWRLLDYETEPMVCVLMTTYNRQEFVADAIQSVVDQTWTDWNLLVVNDGGEDIQDIIDSFNDPRITYYNLPHNGKPAALNFAISHSKSKYIAYLDDDDKYFPYHLESLLTYMEAHPEHEFVHSIAQEVSLVFHENTWIEKSRTVKYAHKVTPQMLRFSNHIPNLCAIHKRSLFESLGLYDESLEVLIDWDMYRRLSTVAPPKLINEFTAEYIKKHTPVNFAEGQLTGLFVTNPVRYYQNRLRILRKPFFISSDSSRQFCCIVYISEENCDDIGFIRKIIKLKNNFNFELLVILDCELSEKNIFMIKLTESIGGYIFWNHQKMELKELIISYLLNSICSKNLLFDNDTYINEINIKNGIALNSTIVDFADKFKDIIPLEQNREAIVNIYGGIENIGISIIIPVFNRSEFTKKCIESIYRFTPTAINFDIIVIDNGSTDDAQEVIEIFSLNHSNISIITNNAFSFSNPYRNPCPVMI